MFIPFRNISTKQSIAAMGLCVGLAYLSKYLDRLIEEAPANKSKAERVWSSFDK